MQLRSVRARQVLLDGQLVPAEITIAGGRIAAVTRLSGPDRDPQVPAAGPGTLVLPPAVVVLPGNVDTHVHINEPGRSTWEGFASATTAAALGGVTSVLDMPLNSIPATVDVPSLRIKQAAARGKLRVDTGFWGGVVPGNTARLRPRWESGVFGFKCFLLPSGVDEFPPLDAAGLREAMREVAGFGGLVIVHAEDARTIAAAPARPSPAYADFLLSRPEVAELAAIRDLLDPTRQTGARTPILHLSSARALDLIAAAKAEGLPLTVETCPHYLCFDAAAIPDGAPEFKCCPPIRDAGNREALWQGLAEGLIDCVVSDHSPSTVQEKYRGAPDLQQAWGGISGLQVGFTAVASQARGRGIGLEQVSRWMSAAPAEFAGLAAKGAIAAGRDADLVFYDPSGPVTVSAAQLAHRNPLSAYDGMQLEGAVVGTVLRGMVLPGGGTPAGVAPGHGRFLTGPGQVPAGGMAAAAAGGRC
ncbi:allantoinase AllB [Arthrobacter deserti]|uniref:allantoinase n=1 Tax=Arthrobacter deserti TaxID=1742687 RepID=A0ABX1JPT7_9MICC|nr:allantoinase AllB [Arthrobacter deserti]